MKGIIKNNIYVIISIAVIYVAGCAVVRTPNDWLYEDADSLQFDSYGGWISLETKGKKRFSGELLSISDDSIFFANKKFYSIEKNKIKNARLVLYEPHLEQFRYYMLGWFFASLVGGKYFVISWPAWLIGGSLSAKSRSFDPVIDFPESDWGELKKYGRYPYGLPDGICRDSIKVKRFKLLGKEYKR